MTNQCPYCRYDNDSKSEYCAACGQPLSLSAVKKEERLSRAKAKSALKKKERLPKIKSRSAHPLITSQIEGHPVMSIIGRILFMVNGLAFIAVGVFLLATLSFFEDIHWVGLLALLMLIAGLVSTAWVVSGRGVFIRIRSFAARMLIVLGWVSLSVPVFLDLLSMPVFFHFDEEVLIPTLIYCILEVSGVTVEYFSNKQ